MKASRSHRRWIALMRKRYGKRNGVISAGLLDSPVWEVESAIRNKATKVTRRDRRLDRDCKRALTEWAMEKDA